MLIIGRILDENHIFISKLQYHAVIGKPVNLFENTKMAVWIHLIVLNAMDGK
jgi:hypothetical protein